VIHKSRVQVLAVVALDKLITQCASVTKQCNLIPVKGVISLAGRVIGVLVKSNGSLPPGL